MGELTDRVEIADAVDREISKLVDQAAGSGEMIWTAQAVVQLQSRFPDASLSTVSLVEAVIRAAAAAGVPVAFHKPETTAPENQAEPSVPSS